MRWSDISSDQLKRSAHVATIIGVPLFLLTVLFGYFQILDGNRAARLTNFITLTTRFFNPINTQIIDAIENGSQFWYQKDNLRKHNLTTI